MKFILATLLPITALIACQGSSDSSKPIAPIKAERTVSINLTFDREIDFAIKDIAVVPNNIAPWAGSLFVIDDSNTLHRSALESGAFTNLATNIDDMTALARKNMAGVILARNLQGQIQGFIEFNDSGDYQPLTLSKAPRNIDRFCSADNLSARRIYAKSGHDISALELFSLNDSYYVEGAIIEDIKTHTANTCLISTSGDDVLALKPPREATMTSILSDNKILFTTAESQSAPRLYMDDGEFITAINITGGLSSDAPSQIDTFYISHDSLGGSLRDGALILADNQSQRLIYISLDFIKKRLSESAPKQSLSE